MRNLGQGKQGVLWGIKNSQYSDTIYLSDTSITRRHTAPPPPTPPGVGHRWNVLVGVCRRGLETLTLFWHKLSITTLVKTRGHFPSPSFISLQDPKNMSCLAAWTCLGLIRNYPWACFIRASEADRAEFIERFHSCVPHLCKFIGKKEGVYIRKELDSQRIDLGHQYGYRDVIWKRSIARSSSTTNINYCSKQPRIHNLNATTIAGQFSLCLQFQSAFSFQVRLESACVGVHMSREVVTNSWFSRTILFPLFNT